MSSTKAYTEIGQPDGSLRSVAARPKKKKKTLLLGSPYKKLCVHVRRIQVSFDSLGVAWTCPLEAISCYARLKGEKILQVIMLGCVY